MKKLIWSCLVACISACGVSSIPDELASTEPAAEASIERSLSGEMGLVFEYYEDATYSTVVGEIVTGCGSYDQWGIQTPYYRRWRFYC